jgi:hypothetical protein
MKLRQRIVLMAGVLGLGVTTTVNTADAQIWANYDATIENIFYNPLAGGILIPDNRFVDFVGNADADDGVANGIRVGFDFDYNGNMYFNDSTSAGYLTNPAIVNVGINGWITIGKRPVPVVTNDNNYLFLRTSLTTLLRRSGEITTTVRSSQDIRLRVSPTAQRIVRIRIQMLHQALFSEHSPSSGETLTLTIRLIQTRSRLSRSRSFRTISQTDRRSLTSVLASSSIMDRSVT